MTKLKWIEKDNCSVTKISDNLYLSESFNGVFLRNKIKYPTRSIRLLYGEIKPLIETLKKLVKK